MKFVKVNSECHNMKTSLNFLLPWQSKFPCKTSAPIILVSFIEQSHFRNYEYTGQHTTEELTGNYMGRDYRAYLIQTSAKKVGLLVILRVYLGWSEIHFYKTSSGSIFTRVNFVVVLFGISYLPLSKTKCWEL